MARLILNALQANHAILQSFLRSEPEGPRIEKANFQCPKYSPDQAAKLFQAGAKIDFSSIDYTAKLKDNRDIAVTGYVTRWMNPNNYTPQGSELMIPYRFKSDHLSGVEQTQVRDALNGMSDDIDNCIQWVDDSSTTHYADFIEVTRFDEDGTKNDGCFSFIGKTTNGAQRLNLGANCLSVGTIQHEFLHAAGFFHEHTRGDRDDHVIVHMNNIKENYRINYEKVPDDKWLDVASPYDQQSVMHYGSTYFRTDAAAAADQYAMTDLQGNPFGTQRERASSIDLEQLTMIYPDHCADVTPTFASCANGHPIKDDRFCDGIPDCHDGSDEGAACMDVFGCCAGKFTVTAWNGAARNIKDMEYKGWETENGRPYFSNGQYSLVMGEYFPTINSCGQGLSSNKYWISFEKTWESPPGCVEFNQAILDAKARDLYLGDEACPALITAIATSACEVVSTTTTTTTTTVGAKYGSVQTFEPVSSLPEGVDIADPVTWENWEDTLLATVEIMNPDIIAVQIADIVHQTNRKWRKVKLLANSEFVVAKQYIFDSPSSVETTTVSMLYPDAVLEGDSEFDTFAAANNIEFPDSNDFTTPAPTTTTIPPTTTTNEQATTTTPVPTRCEGNHTYNEDLSDNGFLAEIGQGLYIVKVISGRGYEGKPPNKPAVGYYDAPYGNDSFHLVGDTVRLGCKLGYSNGIAKPFSGASCQCVDGVCGFQLSNAEFICISEAEQAIPVWTGGVFNFVKAVYTKYIVLKARVANLLSIVEWPFDRVDPDMHPEYLEESYWKTANFTLFVFCPFDVTLGGVSSNTGLMTFPDFYPSEHSKDGFLWSFLSREGTKLWKPRKCLEDPDNPPEIKCIWRSSYFKGFIDRSDNPSQQGPITYNTDFEAGVDYSCETGILAGHHPHAIYNLEYYYPTFQNGTFESMVAYLRNPPFEEEEL